jgi:hypothetical protein
MQNHTTFLGYIKAIDVLQPFVAAATKGCTLHEPQVCFRARFDQDRSKRTACPQLRFSYPMQLHSVMSAGCARSRE